MLKKLLVFCVSVGAAVVVHAQTTANWSVLGTITPGSCAVSLGATGVADYGTIGVATVKGTWDSSNGRYSRGTAGVPLPFSVNCDAGTRFALQFADNQAGTNVGPVSTPPVRFGLGSHLNATTNVSESIGSYYVVYTALKVRDVVGGTLATPTKTLTAATPITATTSWSAAAGAAAADLPTALALGFTTVAASTSPDPLVEVSGNLVFFAEPQVSVIDNAITNVVFNGSATVTLTIL